MSVIQPVTYRTAHLFRRKQVNVLLKNGQWLKGEIVEVRPDGILLWSPNPGWFFLPFTAVALLALAVPFAFGLGYALGRPNYYPPYY